MQSNSFLLINSVALDIRAILFINDLKKKKKTDDALANLPRLHQTVLTAMSEFNMYKDIFDIYHCKELSF